MKFSRQTLSNGLRFICAPQSSAQSVALAIGVGAGQRHEEKRTNGLAHFAEHMFFKGTEKRPHAQEISLPIDEVGGVLNAGTGIEMTYYYTLLPQAHWKLGWDLLADILLHSLFKEEEIEREKGVIAEEINMYYDTPMVYVQEIFQNLMYGDHPLGWDSFGTKEIIGALDRQDFLDFYQKWYQPENLVVVAAGNLVEEELRREVEGSFGDRPTLPVGKPLLISGVETGPKLKVLFKESDQAHAVLGVPAYSVNHPHHYAAEVLAAILGGGMSSRLFVQIRERRGLAYYVRAGYDAYQDTGSLAISAGLNVKKIDEAVTVMLAELGQVAQNLVGEPELRKAKEYLKGHLVLGCEGSRGTMEFLLEEELLEDGAKDLPEVLAKIDAVTAEQVLAVARDLFTAANLHLAVIGPYQDKETASLQQILHL
ncbi:MAG: pitrilysin family protein [bacterium]|nr:pitrilysin family protein [bacterium]